MRLVQNFYGNGSEVYAKETSLEKQEALNLSLREVISKMQSKEADIACILMKDDDSQNLVILSNNESLAKKMDIQFNSDNKNFNLFTNNIDANKIADLVDDRYFENTRIINVDDKSYFSFHCVGKASEKVVEFIEAFVEEQSYEIQRKKSIKY